MHWNRRRSRSRSPPSRGGGSVDRFGRNSRDGYGSNREVSGRDVGRDQREGEKERDSFGRDLPQAGRGRERDDRDRDNRDRGGRRDRSRSRDRDRERDRGGFRDRPRDSRDSYRDRDGINSMEVYDACKDPTCTIILKGLAPRTTEPTDTGECKGYAFVEFYSIEYSQYFHDSFAGSTAKGDKNAPQFIVENRAIYLGYVPDGHVSDYKGSKSDYANQDNKACDWICNQCKCQNFSRREVCFKCGMAKNAQCITLNSDPYNESVIASPVPSAVLIAKGLSMSSSEEDVQEAFRQYAHVKGVTIVRDPITQISKGMALIEFSSIQFATHTLNAAEKMLFEGRPLKVYYAKKSFVDDTITFAQQHAMQAKYAAVAMQAAQWSQNVTDHSSAVQASVIQAAQAAHQQRMSSASVTAAISTPTVQNVKSHWPPCFETQGGSYLFQPNSGMFFESATNFYYCPKSKLYYNGHDGAYYRYDSSLPSPFVLFQPPLPTTDKNVSEETPVATSNPVEKDKKPVSMSLGTDRRAKVAKIFSAAMEEEEEPVIVNTAPSLHIKGRAMNDAERKAAEANAVPKSLAAHRRANMLPKHSRPSGPQDIDRPVSTTMPPGMSAMPTTAPTAAAAAAAATSVPKIVCLLCKRAFKTQEMLARHEKESQLHAENLAKLALSQSQGEEVTGTDGNDASSSSLGAISRPSAADVISGGFVGSSGTVYKDRAAERRAQTGGGVGPSDLSMMKWKGDRDRDERWRSPGYDANKFLRTEKPLPPGMSAEQAAKVYEDEDNVGNVMLRKMGWEENRGLGKDGSGIHDPVSLEGSKIGNDKTGVGTDQEHIPPVAYNSRGAGYKESLLRAAQARYEYLDNKDQK